MSRNVFFYKKLKIKLIHNHEAYRVTGLEICQYYRQDWVKLLIGQINSDISEMFFQFQDPPRSAADTVKL